MSTAARYSAQNVTVDGIPVVRLEDAARHTQVSIVPSIGNIAYDMRVNGKPVLWFPYSSLKELRDRPTFCGIPLLAPWANRLDSDGYYANGKRYQLNAALTNVRHDQNGKPIHGLVSYASEWKVMRLHADDSGAEVTSRLEFWRHPTWMAQFPFAHVIEVTYRLRDGVLEVHTAVENLATEPMPLSLGYHPYFTLSDAPRDDWKVHLAARERVVLSNQLIPTGERKPMELADPLSLRGAQLDDVFTALVRDGDHRADFSVQGKSEKITVRYGPKYPVAVVYAPPGKNFICFEPMTGVTDAFNLNHEGKYRELQSIPPGQKWDESYWIQPSGY